MSMRECTAALSASTPHERQLRMPLSFRYAISRALCALRCRAQERYRRATRASIYAVYGGERRTLNAIHRGRQRDGTLRAARCALRKTCRAMRQRHAMSAAA